MLHRAGCLCGSGLVRFVKQERVRPAFSSTHCVFPRRYEKCSWGGMKTNMLCLQRRKCENSGWSQGRMEARGSWSSGEGRIRGFPPSPLVNPPGFCTVLLLGSLHILKVGGFLFFKFSEFLRNQTFSYNSLFPSWPGNIFQLQCCTREVVFVVVFVVVFSTSLPPSSLQGFVSCLMPSKSAGFERFPSPAVLVVHTG